MLYLWIATFVYVTVSLVVFLIINYKQTKEFEKEVQKLSNDLNDAIAQLSKEDINFEK